MKLEMPPGMWVNMLVCMYAVSSVRCIGTTDDIADNISEDKLRQHAIHHLFEELDSDGDGQIKSGEALKYLSGVLDESSEELDRASTEFIAGMDGEDDDDEFVSEVELQRALSKRLKGTTVENWVQHGLGLPQYRDAFINNAVTVLDFPIFLEDSDLLKTNLGVESKLHRQQMVRAMRALVFGLGEPPHPVQNVHHEADPEGGVAVTWTLASEISNPPVRSVTVARTFTASDAHWHTVAAVSADALTFHDTSVTVAASVYRYSVTAWSSYGRSSATESTLTSHSKGIPATTPRPLRPVLSRSSDSTAAIAAVAAGTGEQQTPFSIAPGVTPYPFVPPPAMPAPQTDSASKELGMPSITKMIAAAMWSLTMAVVMYQFCTGRFTFMPVVRAPLGEASDAQPSSTLAMAAATNEVGSENDANGLDTVQSWLRSLSFTYGQSSSTSSSRRSPRMTAPPATPPMDYTTSNKHGATTLRQCAAPTAGAPGTAGPHVPPLAPLNTSPRVPPLSALNTSPRHVSSLPRSVSTGSLSTAIPSTAANTRVADVRRFHKVLDKCNMKGCSFHKRTLVSSLLHKTCEFHYCYRCQREFCLQHTGVVTHGKVGLGKCPISARCMCVLCVVEKSNRGLTPNPSSNNLLRTAPSRASPRHVTSGDKMLHASHAPPSGAAEHTSACSSAGTSAVASQLVDEARTSQDDVKTPGNASLEDLTCLVDQERSETIGLNSGPVNVDVANEELRTMSKDNRKRSSLFSRKKKA